MTFSSIFVTAIIALLGVTAVFGKQRKFARLALGILIFNAIFVSFGLYEKPVAHFVVSIGMVIILFMIANWVIHMVKQRLN